MVMRESIEGEKEYQTVRDMVRAHEGNGSPASVLAPDVDRNAWNGNPVIGTAFAKLSFGGGSAQSESRASMELSRSLSMPSEHVGSVYGPSGTGTPRETLQTA